MFTIYWHFIFSIYIFSQIIPLCHLKVHPQPLAKERNQPLEVGDASRVLGVTDLSDRTSGVLRRRVNCEGGRSVREGPRDGPPCRFPPRVVFIGGKVWSSVRVKREATPMVTVYQDIAGKVQL